MPEDVIGREDKIDDLCRRWTRIGGGFTVAAADVDVNPEKLLAETARYAEHEPRLFSVAATWLGKHTSLLDGHLLGKEFGKLEGKASAVAGALCDVAKGVPGAPMERLEEVANHCVPLAAPELLFLGMERYPAIVLDDIRANVLPEYARWGLICDEITFKSDAVRPEPWLRKHCPQLFA